MTKPNENHALNVSEAVNHSAEEAIILFNLRFWLNQNKKKSRNIHDGRVWTYNSTQAFTERIPYLTKHQIYRRLKKLESKGIISTGNYNRMKYDRTKWYTINEPEYVISQDCKMEITDSYNQDDSSVKPIPDTNTDTPISKDIGVGMNTDQVSCNSLKGGNRSKNAPRLSKTGRPINYKYWENLFNEVNNADIKMSPDKRDLIASALKIFTEEELEAIIRHRGSSIYWKPEGFMEAVYKIDFYNLFKGHSNLYKWFDRMKSSSKSQLGNIDQTETEAYYRGFRR